MFGVTIGSYNKFEELFRFIIRTKSTMSGIQENLMSQLDEQKEVREMKEAIQQAKSVIQYSQVDARDRDMQDDIFTKGKKGMTGMGEIGANN